MRSSAGRHQPRGNQENRGADKEVMVPAAERAKAGSPRLSSPLLER